jgi:hypothetical protein
VIAGGFAAGTGREMRKALLAGRLLFFAAGIFAFASNPGFHAILRFPNPNEVKTSPKLWR